MQFVPPNFPNRFANKRFIIICSLLVFSFVYLFQMCKLFVILC